MRACAANSCATSGTYTTVTMNDDSSLLSWIVFDSTNALTITPPQGNLQANNPYEVKVVYTPTEGSNTPTYLAL